MLYPTPSPIGRGLERTSAKRSFLRERVWDDRLGAASPLQPADPHPALRATFSQREKGPCFLPLPCLLALLDPQQ